MWGTCRSVLKMCSPTWTLLGLDTANCCQQRFPFLQTSRTLADDHSWTAAKGQQQKRNFKSALRYQMVWTGCCHHPNPAGITQQCCRPAAESSPWPTGLAPAPPPRQQSTCSSTPPANTLVFLGRVDERQSRLFVSANLESDPQQATVEREKSLLTGLNLEQDQARSGGPSC